MNFEADKYLFVAIGSFILSFSCTPIFRRVAVRFNFVDKPNLRKLQPIPVPYLGGLAILLPISIGSIFLPFFAALKIAAYNSQKEHTYLLASKSLTNN
jgi:UDP-GlcNAc:undecaprenyl-phosphate GlcNAc-1-phosphate transferase